MHRDPIPQSARARHERERAHRTPDTPTAVETGDLDYAEIHALAGRSPALTASIYLPTHRPSSERQQDHIRAKNLIHQARDMLKEAGNDHLADSILGGVSEAMADFDFWSHPSDGLALFCTASGYEQLWVPAIMPELAVVSMHSHIKPLMPLLQGDGLFYLLEISQHGATLYKGSRFGLNICELPGAPAWIDEVLGDAEPQRHTEVRTVQSAPGGAVRYFGTSGDEKSKERVSKYFRHIDAIVCGLLHAQNAPLILAGVEYLLPLYREVNRHPRILSTGITGNQNTTPLNMLHERAWELIAPLFSTTDKKVHERYGELHGTERTSADLATVIRASMQGRVADLFVASDSERWGTIDQDIITEHPAHRPLDDDLLNRAVLAAMSTHAYIQVLPRAMMPNHEEIAAIYRY